MIEWTKHELMCSFLYNRPICLSAMLLAVAWADLFDTIIFHAWLEWTGAIVGTGLAL